MRDTGLPGTEIEIIGNSVSLDRFSKVRSPRMPITRALVYHSGAIRNIHTADILAACQKAGITLDHAGGDSGLFLDSPEDHLHQYDLVFCLGRCALEAMASGCAVILAGAEGLGTLVDASNFSALRRRNFGWSLLQSGRDEAWISGQIQRISPTEVAEVAEVTRMVRSECDLPRMADKYLKLYQEIIGGEHSDRSDLASLVSYSLKLSGHRNAYSEWQQSIRIHELEQLCIRNAAAREDMLQSFCWRITAPLRWMDALLRMLQKKVRPKGVEPLTF